MESSKCLLDEFDIHLREAVKITVNKQNLKSISDEQFCQLKCIVQGKNSLTQTPTGSGKTWAAINAPDILGLLRDNFNYTKIPPETRVLYIVPLLAIIQTLKRELSKFEISYQVLDSHHTGGIDQKCKVIVVTPEKLMNAGSIHNICQLSWSAIVIDEPHYILQWGISKKIKGKYVRPFREAFQHLNRLNGLGCPFELHTATAFNIEELFALLGRRDSKWIKQIKAPDRDNLSYYIVDGKNVDDVKQFKFVLEHLESDNEGALLIYVQKIEEGSKIFYSLSEYASENGLIRWPSRDGRPERPIAFLHANLTSERKEEIIDDTIALKIKILVATSSVGSGVNLPIKTLLGWGLDPSAAGIVQASGRTGRKPMISKGSVVWVSFNLLY